MRKRGVRLRASALRYRHQDSATVKIEVEDAGLVLGSHKKSGPGWAAWLELQCGHVGNARALSTCPQAQHQQNRVDSLRPTVVPTRPKNGSGSIRGIEETNE